MIFESHAHYDDEAFDEDRELILGKELPAAGIDTVINVGASLNSCKKTLDLMEMYPYIYGAIGIHPSDTGDLNEENFAGLKEWCTKEKVVAVGEIGLDYHYDEPKKDVQKEWFVKQLHLAKEIGKPVIIHSRDAAKDTMDIMTIEHAEEIGGVVHCYSYTKEVAKTFLDMGFYFGIGGVVTFSNGKKLKETVEILPMDRILLETDCPYLAPTPNRGKRNSSLYIPFIAEEIAKIKGISVEEVYKITSDNGKRLFRI